MCTCTLNTLVDSALARWQTEPQVEIADAYKWIYQATRGGEHAAPEEKTARIWLEREWQTLAAPHANEPLWQPLCPNGEIGRLHLRPFRTQRGQLTDLLAAFVQSSRSFDGDEANFLAAWGELGKRLRNQAYGKLQWQDWQMLDREMRASAYPAIHHSPIYNHERQPAYRVLTGEAARKLMVELKQGNSSRES